MHDCNGILSLLTSHHKNEFMGLEQEGANQIVYHIYIYFALTMNVPKQSHLAINCYCMCWYTALHEIMQDYFSSLNYNDKLLHLMISWFSWYFICALSCFLI